MGPPPEPEPELEYFRSHGVLRLQPLAPIGYTPADATMPPAAPPVVYRRQIWRSPVEVARPFTLILERQTQQTVNLVLRWKADQVFHLRFYHPDHPEETVLELSAGGFPAADLRIDAGGDRKLPAMKAQVSNLGRAYQITIRSNVGESLVAEYSVDDTTVHSPVLTP